MDYIQPLTIASYRAGLPKTRRHRHAHTLIYDLLIELKHRGAEQPEKTLGAELKGGRRRRGHRTSEPLDPE